MVYCVNDQWDDPVSLYRYLGLILVMLLGLLYQNHLLRNFEIWKKFENKIRFCFLAVRPAQRHVFMLVNWVKSRVTLHICTANSLVGVNTRTLVTWENFGLYKRRSSVGSMKANVLPDPVTAHALICKFKICIKILSSFKF